MYVFMNISNVRFTIPYSYIYSIFHLCLMLYINLRCSNAITNFAKDMRLYEEQRFEDNIYLSHTT